MQNYLGETAFYISIKNKLWSNARLLYENNADINIKNGSGMIAKDSLTRQEDLYIYDKIINLQCKKKISNEHEQDNGLIKKGWFY